jgi:hypothetical protein
MSLENQRYKFITNNDKMRVPVLPNPNLMSFNKTTPFIQGTPEENFMKFQMMNKPEVNENVNYGNPNAQPAYKF